jgi:predicted permease
MFNELFAVIAPILICAGVGYGWARRGITYPVDFVTRLVMNIGAPCLILASFSKADIDIGKMAEIATASVVILLIMLVLGVVLIRLMRLKISTILPSLLFSNTGNMGLPLCLFAFYRQLCVGLTYRIHVNGLNINSLNFGGLFSRMRPVN